MNPRPCLLGCTAAAAPGTNACHPCAATLAAVLTDIRDTYATLTDIDELIPGGNNDGGGTRSVPGSKSPAVDALLALADPRTTGDDLPGALGAVAEWARHIRAELSVDTEPDRMRTTVPAGRITMDRELATIRFHWHWVLSQDWLPTFAERMRSLLAAMRHVGRLDPPTLQIGTCPQPAMAIEVADGATLDLLCGATLRVKVGDSEIRCRNCGTVWPRAKWGELGDPWTDYARLSTELDVPVGTLRYWCSRDRWQVDGTRGRRLVLRADALASYAKHRGAATVEQTG